MKTIRRIGWVGKTTKRIIRSDSYHYLYIYDVYAKKGNRMDWGDDWPPRKIRITIEEIK